MRHWTPEERARQASLIRKWQPWKTAGVKTPEGKAKSRMNATKHGLRSQETQEMRHMIALCGKTLKAVRAQLANDAATE